MMTTLVLLVFSAALAFALWTMHATLSEKRAVIVALLRGQSDPRFVARPAALPRTPRVRVRWSAQPVPVAQAPSGWRAAA